MAEPTIEVNNINIRVGIGSLQFNILYIDYEAPRPSWHYGSHSHSSYELHLIPTGKGKLNIMGKDYDLYPGSFYLTGPEVIHEQTADDTDPMSEYCINFEMSFSKRKLSKNDSSIKSEADKICEILTNTSFWYGTDCFDTVLVFEKLINEIDNGLIGCITYIQTLSTQIILNAIRCFIGNSKATYSVPAKNLNDSRRKLVDNYFRDFDRELTAKELAKKIGTSIRQLDRILVHYYSMTFKQKLSVVRLEQVKKLLLTTSLPLWKISEMTGFTNQDSLARAFKKHFNVSPGKFRKTAGAPQ